MISLKNILLENRIHQYECLMVTLPIKGWDKVLDIIDTDDLYIDPDDDSYGKEEYAHVTLLYGIHPDQNIEESIKKFLKDNFPKGVNLQLTGISIFESEKFDVVKFDVESEDCNKINEWLINNVEYTSKFNDYKPHATIAYVTKGKGRKYLKTLKKPFKINSTQYSYSKTNGEKNNFDTSVKKSPISFV